MKKIISITAIASIVIGQSLYAQTIIPAKDSLCGVAVNRDNKGNLLPRYFPNNHNKAYKEVLQITSDFVTYKQPIDHRTGKSLLYTSCCFEGPHMKKSTDVIQGKSIGGNLNAKFDAVDWLHNPACVFAGLTQSLAINMYSFTGNQAYIEVVRKMLDHMLLYGTTPTNFIWANVPYASSDPKDTVYVGSMMLESEAMRGDGLHGIEPDKVGEMGYAYIKFFQITGDKKYLEAALNCADALAKHVKKDVNNLKSNFETTQTRFSPWPFRLNARTGKVYDTYCAHVIEPIKMFDELLRIQQKINLDTSRIRKYSETSKIALDWLFSKNGPMKTYVWNAYFEDIPGDEHQSNRNQVSPMETVRFMLKNPSKFKNIDIDVLALIYYVKSAFGTEGIDAIKEQTWCYEPMASHSVRYASVCAMYYERSKNEWFKEQALRHFNYGTYAVEPSGAAWVGHTWPGSWWSDGYGDFIKHYFDGMAAIPEWAPIDENHLINSTSTIKNIQYTSQSIKYETFDNESNAVLRLKLKPKSIQIGGKQIPILNQTKSGDEGYIIQKANNNWIINIFQKKSSKVEIFM
ncbi:MAG: hypothetical protein EAZ07_10100 [Cytophagales bacterium]|nr:MAG: hypothetical protein EAZ07_10100 [Cytophagales bacterium]